MDLPPAGDAKSGWSDRLGRIGDRFAVLAAATWEHLRIHWTDALLAVGFVFVALLTAYVLVKG